MLNAKELYELIGRAREQYAGNKIHLPEQHYDRERHDMHPSELGLCDLKSALRAAGVPEDYRVDKEWLMNHGNYVAPMIQEPLMMYAMKNPGVAFFPELILRGAVEYEGYSTQSYQGKADGLLIVDGEHYILEIKDTEGVIKRSIGEPSLRYGMQLLAYKLLAGATTNPGFIITCSKWGYDVYELRHVGTGFMIYGTDGAPYTPSWGDDWNTPDSLNYMEVIRKINRKQALIDIAKSARENWSPADLDKLIQSSKITDVLNNKEHGWECVWHYDKGTKTRSGEVRPNCSFAYRCHAMDNRVYYTTKTDGGNYQFEVK